MARFGYAEIPSYSVGFSVGVIGDMYLNPYFNLRFTPTINFGDKRFVFRRPEGGRDGRYGGKIRFVSRYSTSVRFQLFDLSPECKIQCLPAK